MESTCGDLRGLADLEGLAYGRGVVKQVFLALIRFYQKWISPGLPASCRFYPSCSEYTYQAIAKYGILKGGWWGVRRIARCHPFHPGGFDPVP